MKKNLFTDKDVIFSTVFVFAFIGLLKFSFVHIPHMDPVYAAFQDYEFTDLIYRHRAESATIDPDNKVVVVEIGNSREEIANQLRVIRSYHPKVIGLDAYFPKPKDKFTDSILVAELGKKPQVVTGSVLEGHEHSEYANQTNSFWPMWSMPFGYMNFIGEENKTIRYFATKISVGEKHSLPFADAIVKEYNWETYKNKLDGRGNKVEYINYRKPQSAYITLSKNDIAEGNASLEIIKDKIVLIGSTNPTDVSDLHFSPMNERGAGRSKPDMPGVYIHANTIEMILKGDYVNKIPDWVVLIFSVLLTYITIVLYTYFYVEKHIWFHLVAKLFQFALFFLFLYLEVILLDKTNLRFSDKIILVPIVLAVDLLYFYDAFVKWLHGRFGYHTYFMKGH